MRGSLVAAVAAGSILLSGPAGAAASDHGVYVDPESPAAKEYAIPLDAARRAASGRGDDAPAPPPPAPAPAPPAQTATTAQVPLFGSGIRPRRRGDAARRRDRGRSRPPRSAAGTAGAPAVPTAATSVRPSPELSMALVGAIVLIAGGLLALLARRGGGRQPSR
ncbi:MAG TPA: hypothetical protein VM266_12075 [Solirubrobacteraceae bacterium]|nr:hypothetical protein [Solirubrobacteraceae bacterium]